MKKMLTENWGLKLFSVAVAFILWIVIVYTYDPVATADFTLNVNIINGDSITSLGKVYEVIEGDTVTIRAKANSTLLKTLKASDFRATADVSELSPTYHANIDVVCTKSNYVDISLVGDAKFLAVKLDDLVKKQFSVKVDRHGDAENGYYVGAATPKPNLITVSGGKSSIEKIAAVKAAVDVTGAYETFYTNSVPKAYDEAGNEITTGNLKFSVNPVSVSINVYQTKTVPVYVKAEGEPYDGYIVDSIDYEPKSVTVAGDTKALESITDITMPLDVTGEITNVETGIHITTDSIPDGIYLTDSDTVINVNCKIVRMSAKDIYVTTSDIKLVHTDENFDYSFVNTSGVRVTAKGHDSTVSSVSLEMLAPYIDLEGIREEGEYSLMLQFKEVKGITLSEIEPITIKVTLKNSKTEDENGNNASDNEDGENENNHSNEDDSENENKTSEETENGENAGGEDHAGNT